MEFNAELEELRPQLRNLLSINKDRTDAALVKIFEQFFLGQTDRPQTLIQVYKAFVNEHSKIRAPRTIMKYNSLKVALEAFQKKQPDPLTFEQIDVHFYDKFTDYLRTKDKPLLDDTVSKYISNLKTFMDWAFERDFHRTIDYKKFASPKGPQG